MGKDLPHVVAEPIVLLRWAHQGARVPRRESNALIMSAAFAVQRSSCLCSLRKVAQGVNSHGLLTRRHGIYT